MPKFNTPRAILTGYGSFVAFYSLLIAVWIVSSPSEPGSQILLGLSTPRLLLVLGLLTASGFYATIASRAVRLPDWAEHTLAKWFGGKGPSRWIGWLSGISLGLGWIGCFLPAYRLGAWSEYWVRLQPAMVFILLTGLMTLIVFALTRIKSLDFSSVKLGLPLFAACGLLLGVMLFSKFGVISADDFWYGAGVPILAGQLLAVMAGGILFLYFDARWRSRRGDFLICILLYAVTAFFWAREPLQRNFFFTESQAPYQALYPFADAATFDLASQYTLIGQAIQVSNGLFYERPLYIAFVAYVHTLFGQNYETMMVFQAALFAVLPVLFFLIGRSLGLRTVGFMAAMVAGLRGLNSMAAGNLIDTASPKIMLTDFPAAIGVALIVLLTSEWLREPSRKWHYPIWLGGVLGFTILLRTNAIILLAFIPLFALQKLASTWRQRLSGALLIMLGVIAITLPWELRNQSLGGQLYGSFITKFQAVIQQRYLDQPVPDTSMPGEPEISSTTLNTLQPIFAVNQDNGNKPQVCDSVICFSANHLLHNLITTLLVLPTSPVLDNLSFPIKERSPGYWNGGWDGSLTPSAAFFLSLNLFFITLGISLAWKEKHLPGLAPIAIFVAYNISNGLARTSGGRYLVPVDWILLLYYLIGVFHILTWGANQLGIHWNLFSSPHKVETSNREAFSAKALGAFATLFLLGALIPLAENLHLPRYQNLNPLEMLAENRSRIEETGIKVYELDTFLQSPGANILVGRALYPRYYKMNQGEIGAHFHPYLLMEFPRTAFKLIGPAGESSIILSGLTPAKIPHAGDLLVLGCNEENYFDALVVIPLDENGEIYVRHPLAPLQCPMPEPVCDNNSVCH